MEVKVLPQIPVRSHQYTRDFGEPGCRTGSVAEQTYGQYLKHPCVKLRPAVLKVMPMWQTACCVALLSTPGLHRRAQHQAPAMST